MGLEAGTYINDLVPTNPTSSDGVSQGDDHIRLIKTVLKNTFPGATKALPFPSGSSKTGNYTILAADNLTAFFLSTASTPITLTLPSLVLGDTGWFCEILKTSTDANPVLINPPSGSLMSGDQLVSSARRCIPGVRCKIVWTGSVFVVERAAKLPIGSIIDNMRSTLPPGYEWAAGQTLSSATNYPEYNAAMGGLGVVDMCGRVGAGRDGMGSGATRIGTVVTDIGTIVGATLGSNGGSPTHQQAGSEVGQHLHPLPNLSHTHSLPTLPDTTSQSLSPGGFSCPSSYTSSSYVSGGPSITMNGLSTNNNISGLPSATAMFQPTMIVNKIVVVE